MAVSRVERMGAVLAMSLLAACGGKAGGAADAVGSPADAAVEQQPDAPASGDAADGGDAATDTTADALAAGPKDVCLAALTAQCMRHAVCQGGDVPSCLALEADHCPDYYFSAYTNRTVENVQACLPALAALTCTDIAMGIVPSCLLNGKIGPGQPCLYTSQCQSYCADGIDRCGTCGAGVPVATGAACAVSGSYCAVTDFCHPATKVCVAKSSITYAEQGQPCDLHADPVVGCKGDLVCALPSSSVTQGTCHPIPQLGEPCGDVGDTIGVRPCGAGLTCDTTSHSCRPVGQCGSVSCDLTSSFCRTGGEPMGSAACVPLASEGAACDLGTTAALEVRCAAGLGCQGATVAAPAGGCGKPGAVGDACDASHFCGAGLQCSAATAGQCVVFAADSCFAAGGPDGGAGGP